MTLRYFDLCSGVGVGFPLAAVMVGGFNLRGLADIDSYCQDILKLRYPGVRVHGDISDIKNIYDIDLITASPPCQPFSQAGLREGSNDPRDCFPKVFKVIDYVKPRFVAIENVSGLLSCAYRPGEEKGSYFKYVLQEFYKRGFDVEWLCVHSADFGAPFLGKRLLMVAATNGTIEQKEQAPWSEQVRLQIKEFRDYIQGSGSEPRIYRDAVLPSNRLDIAPGITERDRISVKRRSALGNSLDWRLAAIALERVKFLSQPENGKNSLIALLKDW